MRWGCASGCRGIFGWVGWSPDILLLAVRERVKPYKGWLTCPLIGRFWWSCVLDTRYGEPNKVNNASSDWGIPRLALNPCVIFRSYITKSPCSVVRGVVAVTDVAVGLADPSASPAKKRTTGVMAGAAVGAAAIPSATLVERHVPPAVSVISSNAPLSFILLLVLLFLCPFAFPDFYCFSRAAKVWSNLIKPKAAKEKEEWEHRESFTVCYLYLSRPSTHVNTRVRAETLSLRTYSYVVRNLIPQDILKMLAPLLPIHS